MNRPSRRAAILLLAFAALGAWSCSSGGDKTTPEVQSTAPVVDPAATPPTETTNEAASAPLEQHTVEVYFPSRMGDGLIGEYRAIFQTVTPGDRAKQIVADLISGPTTDEALRAVPPGTRLRQAYVLDSGVAFLDFSSQLRTGIGGGSMDELLTVYSIVNSVVFNVSEIKRITILIDGKPVETLNGHLDLRRALAPDGTLILAPTVVQAEPIGSPVAALTGVTER